MGMRREFKGRGKMGGWVQFIPAIASVASGFLGRKDAKDAAKQANKPIPTTQRIQETSTNTAPEWLESFLTGNLFPRFDSIQGSLNEKIDPSVGQFQMSPYMDQAAQGMGGWMNSPLFTQTMAQGGGALGQLLGGMNPALAFTNQTNPILMQALQGMLGMGSNGDLGYGSQVQNNLQQMIDKAFGGGGGPSGGGGSQDYLPYWRPNSGYNSNLNTTPSNPGAPDAFRSQYLDMIASGRNDFLTPWGYGRSNGNDSGQGRPGGGNIPNTLHQLLGGGR